MIDVKSTGDVSEIEVLNTSEQLAWDCSITEALNEHGRNRMECQLHW